MLILKILCQSLLHIGTCVKYHDSVSHLQSQLQIMGDKKDPCPLVRYLPEVGQHTPGRADMKARRGFICNNQSGMLHHGCGNKYPSGHSPGQFKRIQLFRILSQPVAPHGLAAALHALPVFLSPSYLFSHLHKRIQIRHALGDQYHPAPPKLFLFLLGQDFSLKGNRPLTGGILRQKSHDRMGQQALSRTAGSGYGHHLMFPYLYVQIPNHGKLPLAPSPHILGK